MRLLHFISLVALPLTLATPSPSPDIFSPSTYDKSSVIHKDVLILGGGSTGTYSTLRLRSHHLSTLTIEPTSRLGGHTYTFRDPATSVTFDIGVITFHNTTLVRSYFSRFSIPLITGLSMTSPVFYTADFRTGLALSLPAPNPIETTEALEKYEAVVNKYPELQKGWYILRPLPEELVLPFGEFARREGIQAAVPVIASYGQGLADVENTPTAYVLKLVGSAVLRSIREGFLTTARRNNYELYEKARVELGDDVWFNSRVVASKRTQEGVVAVVATGKERRLVIARRMLVTAPPTRLTGLDLSKKEKALFARFREFGYYTGVLRNTGIPNDTSVVNIDPASDFGIPKLPGVYSFSPAGPHLHDVKYASPEPLENSAVKADILASLRRLKIPQLGELGREAEWAVFKGHVPFLLHVAGEDIRDGFYERLYGLQGKRGTWWTGAAWHTHDSSVLWEFSEGVVRRMVQGLGRRWDGGWKEYE